MKNLEGGLEATSLEKEEEGSNERDERKRKRGRRREEARECKAAGGKHARRKFNKFK
jgi:hypothetical protein